MGLGEKRIGTGVAMDNPLFEIAVGMIWDRTRLIRDMRPF